MKKFPFFASIKPSMFSNNTREGNIKLIRDTLLQSDNSIRFYGWNKTNFLNSIDKGSVQYYCVICVSVTFLLDDIYVFLESGEKLLLKEVLQITTDKQYPLVLLFLYCDEFERLQLENKINNYRYSKTCIIISSKDKKKFLFALACELINWWGLASTKLINVSFLHIVNCVRTTVLNYELCVGQNSFKYTFLDSFSEVSGIAWSDGIKYSNNADIEKILNNAREEQIADTIKRISDSANHPRDQHLSKQERLISSQGLFWLSEIEDLNDIDEWIVDTRFYLDISSENHKYKISKEIKRKEIIELFFLEQLMKSFVVIPSGVYSFGTLETDIDSEPPAQLYSAFLEKFSILKFPITEKFWFALIENGEINSSSDLPVVNVNYFEALQFVNILNDILHSYFPQQFCDLQLNLPTEYQWEAAARGVEARNYPWGNNFDQSLCNCEMIIKRPTEVGKYSPKGDSPFGCQDMAGNVREWTRSYGGTRGVDWKTHSNETILGNNTKIISSSRMIIKGGSYSYSSECVQNWVRNTQIASRKDFQTGFRIVIQNMPHE
jgi:formylglycine-generating enzyme required for sulfatase activity